MKPYIFKQMLTKDFFSQETVKNSYEPIWNYTQMEPWSQKQFFEGDGVGETVTEHIKSMPQLTLQLWLKAKWKQYARKVEYSS